MNITINIQDDVSPGLGRLLAGLRDPTPVVREAGTALKSIVEGTFNSVGAHYRPTPWPPKSDGRPSILQKSGRLAHSFHLTVGRTWARVGTDAPYAAIHQFGGQTGPSVIRPRRRKALASTSAKFGKVIVRSVQHPGSRIPPRPFFPLVGGRLTAMATIQITRAAERQVQREIARAGLA